MTNLPGAVSVAERRDRLQSRTNNGFTLVELLVTVAVFTVVAGVAFSLFAQHVALATRQQNLSGVNIGMRNAMAQLEVDLAGAGPNVLSTVAQNFSLGVVIQNNVPGAAGITACAVNTANWSYPVPSACFDSLAILGPKACSGAGCPVTGYVPVLQINDLNDDLSATTTINAGPTNVSDVLATDAAFFTKGDELLVLLPTNTASQQNCPKNSSASSQSPYCMTVVTLTGNATVVGGNIVLTHSLTGASGLPVACPGATCTDPLGLIYSSAHASNYAPALMPAFSQGSFIIDLGTGSNDIWYSVQANPANANDPQLMRCLGGPCTVATGQPLTDQVIGFKVGATLWGNNPTNQADLGSYFYNAANYCDGAIEATFGTPPTYANCTTTPPPNNDPYDYTLVRSVRVSMVARTTPGADETAYKLSNGFDGGHYLIQQSSIVVDLRGMSNADFGN
jgi:prepilin-type N-terminal cleavage/methylation domain-containing protein